MSQFHTISQNPMPSATRILQGVQFTLALAVAFCLMTVACTSESQQREVITVFAASSLIDSFRDIAQEFEAANPDAEIRFNFAGSQRLRSQLELGAEADVFASANEQQMDLILEAGLLEGEPRYFASSTMAVIASRDSPVHTPEDLAAPGTRLVLAHGSVPAGAYARLVLETLSASESGLGDDFSDRVLANLVSEETTVKFVEQKVVLGQADAGIVYRPGLLTATADGSAREVSLPPNASSVKARFPVAVLKGSDRAALAARFVEFVLSPSGQDTLAGYGFGPP